MSSILTENDWGRLDASPGQPAPLLVHNLLNDLNSLSQLFLDQLRRGAWLNAYLLAAGMNQIVEDYLHPDPFFLAKATKYLSRVRRPVGSLAAGLAKILAAGINRARGYRKATRRVLRWQSSLSGCVLRLAEKVISDSPATDATSGELIKLGENLIASQNDLPSGLLREVLRIPSCFRSFDQQPADLERIVQMFAQSQPQRSTPLIVVGIRTSGSYLAPLYVAFLKACGYQDVRVLTLRPGRQLLDSERAVLETVIQQNGLVLLSDDPPVTGGSLAKAARNLEQVGVPQRSIILLLQLFGPRDSMPPRLERYSAVLLPWEEWTIHKKLAPSAVQSALEKLSNPTIMVHRIERLSLPPRKSARSHIHALFRAQLSERDLDRTWEQQFFVRGVGLGYFGEYSITVAQSLRRFLPQVYGIQGGLIYSAWLPEERRLSSIKPGKEQSLADKVVEYTAARHRALAVEEDMGIRLVGEMPGWEVASSIFSKEFGRGWLFARMPLVDPVIKRLLCVEHPSVIDGRMGLSHWFADESGSGLLKADFDEGTFTNAVDLACYDPVFDLASLVASVDLGGFNLQANKLGQYLRAAYENLLRETIDEERWLLYQLVHLWDVEHTDLKERNRVRRASSRAVQRYFSEIFFRDLKPNAAGELCSIDLDGVLETCPLGFSSSTATGALALRALMLHGYRPILATGRSLDEVKERCEAYHLAGGVAEYGAVAYNHIAKTARLLISESDIADLDRLRQALCDIESVHIDMDYRHAVRAYCLDSTGQRRGLGPEMVATALRKSRLGERMRPIIGESQTDFVVDGIDKATGVRILANDLGVHVDGKLLALAVGDTLSDLPMLELARTACVPANADPRVKRARVKVMGYPYQTGLSHAASHLLGHRPGDCSICRAPSLLPETRLLLTLLATQECGKWSIFKNAILLGTRFRE